MYEELVEKMYRVFSESEKPNVDEMTPHRCLECDEVRDQLHPYNMREVQDKLLIYHGDALSLLSAKAIRYYFTGYIEFGLLNQDCNAYDNCLYQLAPGEIDDSWKERIAIFRMNPTIEFACLSDANEIARLSRDYVEFGLGWKYTPEKVKSIMSQATKNVVVARQGDKLLGFGIMSYDNDNANLDLLAVKTGYRRQGVGRQIVEWLVQVAVAAGAHSVYVQVRKRNRRAIEFYREFNFYEIEEMEGYYRGQESGVILCKSLRPVFTGT